MEKRASKFVDAEARILSPQFFLSRIGAQLKQGHEFGPAEPGPQCHKRAGQAGDQAPAEDSDAALDPLLQVRIIKNPVEELDAVADGAVLPGKDVGPQPFQACRGVRCPCR